MRRMALLAGLAVAAPAVAEPVAVTNDALRQLASGKTVHLESPYGTLPVTFKPDGTLTATASSGLAFYLGSLSDRGRWTVQGDRICQKFFKWFAGETHCMRIRQEGRKISWRRDDGLAGTATIAANEAPPPERPVGLGVGAAELTKAVTPSPPNSSASLPSAARDAAAKHEAVAETLSPARATVAPVWSAVAATSEPEAALKMPPRPILASLPGLPRGLLGGSKQAKDSEPVAPALARIEPPMPTALIARGDLVVELLEARLAQMWCQRADMAPAPSQRTAGHDRPFIFASVADLAPVAEISQLEAQGTECLMPSTALAEAARRLAGGGH